MLAGLSQINVQNETYARRFRELGADPDRVHVTGSLKFDGAATSRDNPLTRELVRQWQCETGDLVFLAGSTQAPEERLAIHTFAALAVEHPHLHLIVVPRHPERFEEVASLLNESGLPWQRRSRLSVEGRDRGARILLVDCVGELAAWWGMAQIAYVGGSMGRRGGQNMIEPAAYGAAVSFGPNTENFRDVVSLLLESGAAVVVQNGDELTAFVRRCLDDPSWAASLGAAASRLVCQQLGATMRTVDLVERLTRNSAPREAAA
jgi:3-deoxy-D-manno-octulosonic-acid transferase